MHIRPLLSIGFAVFLVPAATLARAHDRPTPKSRPPVQVAMFGEIIDPQCYFTHASRGKEHASCARTCARGGQDLSFLDERSGRVYPLIAPGHGKNPNDTVLALAGYRVEVRGTIYGMGQDVVLAVASASVAPDWEVISGSSTTIALPGTKAKR